MNEHISIDIILVNWNAGHQLTDALSPLLKFEGFEQIHINCIVVDNASTDGSVALLDGYPVQLIQSTENLGFGKACNLAYPHCTGDCILLLNPDTKWEIQVLAALAIQLMATNSIGCIGPRQVDELGNTIRTCGRFPNFWQALTDTLGLSKAFPQWFTPAPIMKDWPHNESKIVDHIMGSFMLLKKEALQKTGFFDDAFFMYYEDLDLSKRLSKAGYSSFYNSSLSIYHKCGGTSNQIKGKRLYYSISSRLQYYRKYFNPLPFYALLITTFIAEPFIRITQAVLSGSLKNVGQIILAYKLLFLHKSSKRIS